MPTPPDRLIAALKDRYLLERKLGQGGMATVYLAEDLKHDRKVALKVLKPELAAAVGAERFLAEIKTTANLRHPHILPLFDSGQDDGFLWYVMPYVEGESLRERIDREKQLPVAEAVAIARRVAGALQVAHDSGVVHRDIKPANILLENGEPVVADFGIALALGEAGGGRLTETGLSLGTPYYMSPEQATGDRDPDARSDVYALGAVLYEMLAGEPPFDGKTAQAIVGRILTADPVPPTEARRSIPENVEAAILTALEKTPADRFGSARAFGEALADPAYRSEASGKQAAPTGGGATHRAAIAATMAAVLFGALAAWGWSRPTPDAPPSAALRASLLFPTDSGPTVEGLALSPDETELAYVSTPRLDGGRIWIRSLESGQRRVIEGTEGAAEIAWSPRGDRIAYRVEEVEIRVIPVEGGPVTFAARIESGLGPPRWDVDGSRILFVADGGVWSALDGAADAALVVPLEPSFNPGPTIVEALPESRRFLIAGTITGEGWGVWAGDFDTPGLQPLVEGAAYALYRDGWLVRQSRRVEGENTLVAQRFDPDAMSLDGPAVPIATGFQTPGGVPQVTIGRSTVVLAPFGGTRISTLGWWEEGGGDIEGLPERTTSPGWMYGLSSDGSRIAIGGGNGLWVADSDAGLPRRIEGTEGRVVWPRWSEDDRRIMYGSGDGLRAVGTSPGDTATLIAASEGRRSYQAVGWGPADEVLYIEYPGDGSADLRVRADGGRGEARTLQAGTDQADLSPDGEWIAYVSDQGGAERQVFVRSYRGDQEQRISVDGGAVPFWAPSGDAVYYATPTGEGRVVSLTYDGGLRASPPRELPIDVPVWSLSPHPDGRLLLNLASGALEELVVLRDWKAVGGG